MTIVMLTYGKIVSQKNYKLINQSIIDALKKSNVQRYEMYCYDNHKGAYHLFTASVWSNEAELLKYACLDEHTKLKKFIEDKNLVETEVKKFDSDKDVFQFTNYELGHLEYFIQTSFREKAHIFGIFYQEKKQHPVEQSFLIQSSIYNGQESSDFMGGTDEFIVDL